MFLEFDTFDDFVCVSVNLVKDIPSDYRVNCFILAPPQTVHGTTRLVNCLGFTVLSSNKSTEIFQVLMVPS
jgi:hypothetical protein